jgi:hypothetical protein
MCAEVGVDHGQGHVEVVQLLSGCHEMLSVSDLSQLRKVFQAIRHVVESEIVSTAHITYPQDSFVTLEVVRTEQRWSVAQF